MLHDKCTFVSHSDWNFVLGDYLTYTSLTTLNLKFVRAVPLVPILSSPHLRKLALEGCSINEEPRWPTKREVIEGFNLTNFAQRAAHDKSLWPSFYRDFRDTPPLIEHDHSNLPFAKLLK
ncbi:hypothetical protein BJ165DRAFT_1402905 [Panaeolus papilionaceus]|nr:hypothetical protein BJ165DRAFT_1402905 [Panaeolus papilionaceus]